MTFEAAVRQTSDIAGLFEDGLRAVKGEHRRRLVKRGQCRWRGSVDLDGGLSAQYPDQPRWDYAVGFCSGSSADRVAYVEVHPAATGNVREVLEKLEWLKSWLQGRATNLNRVHLGGFFWIATGSVRIQKGSPQSRRLALAGIKVGTVAHIG